jgi:hypothetical protein
VSIPDSVTSIGSYAFSYCTSLMSLTVAPANPIYSSLDGVLFNKTQTELIQCPGGKAGEYTIPGSVIEIGRSAFNSCDNLTAVTIPDSVTNIDRSAFSSCDNLTSVMIPDSVTSIGSSAFHFCSSLIDLTIAPANPAYSSLDGILFNKTQTELILYPGGKTGDYVIPKSVISIDNNAFNSCGLTSVTLGNSVTTIGIWAFYNCSNLTGITVDPSNPAFSSLEGVLYNKAQTEIIQYPGGKAGDYLFPDSVTTIGDLSLSSCPNLTGIIASEANPLFSSIDGVLYNKAQTEVVQYPGGRTGNYVIPDGVTAIGQNAFAHLGGLTTVIIPDSVTTIKDFAIIDSSGLKGIYFKGNAPSAGTGSLGGSTRATVYYLPGTTGWNATYAFLPTAEWPLSPADIDIDGYVNFTDFALFAGQWLRADCEEANDWCRWADFDESTDVGLPDLDVLTAYWLDVSIWTPSPADVDLDGEVDLYDFSLLAVRWGQTDCDASNDWCGWADFDRSGTVDVLDLSLLVDDWLFGIMP